MVLAGARRRDTDRLVAAVSPRTAYLVAASSWFMGIGIQMVVFAWLVTIVLREPAEFVVDQRQQLVGRLPVAPARGLQDTRHVGFFRHLR